MPRSGCSCGCGVLIVSSESFDRGRYLGALLRLAWQWVREEIFLGVAAAGYDDVNRAHVGLFRYPTLDGLRPTTLADELQITKQSVNDLVGHLEQRGYLTREPDPSDGRARVVRLTPKGRRLERTINAQAQATEQRITGMLGPRSFRQVHQALEELADRVSLNDVSPVPAERQ